MLAKDPKARFQTANEIKGAVDGLLRDPKMWPVNGSHATVPASKKRPSVALDSEESADLPSSALTPNSGIPRLEKMLAENKSQTKEVHILAALGDLYEKVGEHDKARRYFKRPPDDCRKTSSSATTP